MNRLVLEGESGDYINGSRYSDETAVTVSPVAWEQMFNSTSWTASFRSPSDVVPLAPGVYEGATRAAFRTVGTPGLDVYGQGRGCNTVLGRFVVDQAEYDGAGTATAFAARFEQHCEGGGPALFGTVAFNATVPVYAHHLSTYSVGFPTIPAGVSSVSSPVTITNTSTVPLPVTTVAVTGAGAAQFHVDADGCTGTTLALAGSCTVSVSFVPAAAGAAKAALTINDAFTAWGTAPVGEDVALTGTATAPPTIAGGEFTPLAPSRILDTRDGTGLGGRPHRLSPGESIAFQVADVGGVPGGGVSAVAVNLTATGSTTGGWLALYPSGTEWPGSSSVNFPAGGTAPNMVIMAIGSDGMLSLKNCCGQTEAIVDVVGWYGRLASPPALAYNAMPPVRVLDTRSNGGPLGGRQSRPLHLAGSVVPATASAVVVNLTATEPTVATYVTAYPNGTDLPNASSLNVAARETRPNLVTVKLGADGSIALFNAAGQVQLIVDVVGYYDASRSPSGRVVTGSPIRLFDTREIGDPLGAREQAFLDFTGVDGCVHVEGVVLNITATQPTAPSYLTLFPSGSALPTASNLNVVAGQTIANLVMVKVPADGRVMIYNNAGSVHLVGDLVGAITLDSSLNPSCPGARLFGPVATDAARELGRHPID